MEQTILRIYIPLRAKWTGEMKWTQKLLGVPLSHNLLKKAKEFGIDQAIGHHVIGGYLKGKKLIFNMGEVPSHDLPQCIELIDTPDTLKKFCEEYKNQLNECRVIIFTGLHL